MLLLCIGAFVIDGGFVIVVALSLWWLCHCDCFVDVWLCCCGGFVMIPLMTSSLLKLTQHQAHGTSLFAVAATGIAGALGYAEQVQLEAAGMIACFGMVTARLGAALTAKLSERVLKRALGIFMICVAPMVPLKHYFVGLADEPAPPAGRGGNHL